MGPLHPQYPWSPSPTPSNYSHLEVTSDPQRHRFICQREAERHTEKSRGGRHQERHRGTGHYAAYRRQFLGGHPSPCSSSRCCPASLSDRRPAGRRRAIIGSDLWRRQWQPNASVSVKRRCQHAAHASHAGISPERTRWRAGGVTTHAWPLDSRRHCRGSR